MEIFVLVIVLKKNTSIYIVKNLTSLVYKSDTRAGANLNLQSPRGFTALMLSARQGRLDIAFLLLDAGAIKDLETVDGENALTLALRNNNFAMAKVLFGKQAELSRNKKVFEALVCAFKGDRDFFERLINDFGSSSALRRAAEHNSLEITEELLLNEVDVNARNKEGKTALMIATRSNNVDVAIYLLFRGASPLMEDKDGRTARDFAQIYWNQSDDLIHILRNAEKYRLITDSKLTENYSWMDEMDNPNSFLYMRASLSEFILHCAIADSKENCVMTLLKSKKVNVNDLLLNACPLHFSAYKGDLDVTKQLIKLGANLNIQDSKGLTSVIVAVMKKHEDVATILIANGARLDIRTRSQGTVLVYAIMNKCYETVKLIIADSKKKINMSFRIRVFALFRDRQMFEMLINKLRSGIDAEYSDRYTLLMEAAEENMLFVIQELVFLGAEINHQSSDGKTALIMAVKKSSLEAVEYLLRLGADKSIRDKDGQKAIDYAQDDTMRAALTDIQVNTTMEPKYYWLDELRNKNSIIFQYRALSEIYLPFAVANLKIDDINRILKVPETDVNELFLGASPLHFAAEIGNPQIVKLLLKTGASIDLQDCSNGLTSLQIAAKRGDLQITQILLSEGADIHLEGKNGATALVFALENNHFDIAKLLTKYKAKLDFNRQFISVLEVAMMSEDMQLFSSLIKNVGSKLNKELDGLTLLIIAVKHGLIPAVQLLLLNGADKDHQNIEGTTALMFAVKLDNLEVANFLIHIFNAHVSVKDKCGRKAIDYVENSNQDMTNMLKLAEEKQNQLGCANSSKHKLEDIEQDFLYLLGSTNEQTEIDESNDLEVIQNLVQD